MKQPNAKEHHRKHDSKYIARLVKRSGMTQQAIADQLGCSLRSIQRHCATEDNQNCANGGAAISYCFQYALESLVSLKKGSTDA